MARLSPSDKLERLTLFIAAWECNARGKSFGGRSLAGFKAVVEPSLTVRKKIADLRAELRNAIKQRDAADRVSFEVLYRIGLCVQGDADFGRDSALFAAMGYTTERDRRKAIRRGLRRKRARSRAAGSAGSG